MLCQIVRVATEVGNGRLTSHWPLVGRNFDHGVLVVGQAVYGWIPDWTATDATTAAGRMAILDDTKATFSDLDDPMSWIGGHRVENSPFWRTVHGSPTWSARAGPAGPYLRHVFRYRLRAAPVPVPAMYLPLAEPPAVGGRRPNDTPLQLHIDNACGCVV